MVVQANMEMMHIKNWSDYSIMVVQNDTVNDGHTKD